MNRESVAKLKLDQRLKNRRNWISKEELETALENLPDSAGNAIRLGDEAPEDGEEWEPSGARE